MNESLLQLVTAYSFDAQPEKSLVIEKGPNFKKKGAALVTTVIPASDQSVVDRTTLPSSSSSTSSSPLNVTIMNTASYDSANDPSSNLHLLSKVIEETECDTMLSLVQRGAPATTSENPKRVSLPSFGPCVINPDSTVQKISETPTSCVNANENMFHTVNSWKKKAILDMVTANATSSDTPPSSNTEALRGNDHPNCHHNEVAATTTADGSNSTSLLHYMTLLPPNFQPGPYDVLCGRGRACKDAPGNKAYRDIIMNQLHVYAESTTKIAKGKIISNIMDQIKQHCHQHHQENVGGFVKYSNGRWYEVGEFLAREKTSQCFRDALAAQYSSSAQSKYLRRRANKDVITDDNDTGRITNNTLGIRKVHAPNETTTGSNLVTEITNPTQHPMKKTRYATEDVAVDALQQKASLSEDVIIKLPSCSPSPDTSPKLTSNPSSATTSGTVSSTFTSLDYSTKLSAPSIALPVATRFESRSVLLPLQDSLHVDVVNKGTVDMRNRPNAASAIFVCALQLALRPPEENPWDTILRAERQIESIVASDSVDIIVLPELAPIGYSEDTFTNFLPINVANQTLYQEFDRFFQVAARKFNVYICYGTIGWSYENRNLAMVRLGVPRLFIRQIVVDRLGTQVACYDKTYLCNYGECAESRYFQPGPASVPTSFPVYNRDRTSVYRFGLLICSDIRYPNLARALASDPEHAVDCILQPAAFVRDYSFRTWSSFRETRAVENSIFWIGINYAGTKYGETCIVPPFVDHEHEPITLECEEGYVIGRVARSTLDHARTQFPFYRNMLLEESIKLRK